VLAAAVNLKMQAGSTVISISPQGFRSKLKALNEPPSFQCCVDGELEAASSRERRGRFSFDGSLATAIENGRGRLFLAVATSIDPVSLIRAPGVVAIALRPDERPCSCNRDWVGLFSVPRSADHCTEQSFNSLSYYLDGRSPFGLRLRNGSVRNATSEGDVLMERAGFNLRRKPYESPI